MDMAELWLKPNRRALLLGMILPLVLSALAGYTIWRAREILWLQVVGAAVLGGGIMVVCLLLRSCLQPRIAYRKGELLLYFSMGRPIALPIHIVECFFLGTATTPIARSGKSDTKVSTLVIRLSESAGQWNQRELKRSIGNWKDGYITILGLWCERLNPGKVNQLNARLAEVQRTDKQHHNPSTKKPS